MNVLWEEYKHLLEPLEPHLPWIIAVSVTASVLGLMMIPVVAILMPRDYFVRPLRIVPTTSRFPAGRWLFFIARNVIGVGLMALGILFVPLPGNGLVLVLIGLMACDFKWKRRWLRRMIRRPSVHRPINWLRRKAGRPPVELPIAIDDDSPIVAAAPLGDASSNV